MDKRSISLSPRLLALANWVREEKNILFADIGTDHGYLPLYLIQEGVCTQGIASDLNEGPLARAKVLSEQYAIALDLRLSNGLEKILPDEVNTISIAGMGGITIGNILMEWKQKHPQSWQGRFLLQPMSAMFELRQYLNGEGYTIVKEITIREGDTLYTAICAEEGKESAYTFGELLVGRYHPTYPDPLREELLTFWMGKTESTLSKIPEYQTQRREELQTQLVALEREYKEYMNLRNE